MFGGCRGKLILSSLRRFTDSRILHSLDLDCVIIPCIRHINDVIFCLLNIYDVTSCLLHILEIDLHEVGFTDTKLPYVSDLQQPAVCLAHSSRAYLVQQPHVLTRSRISRPAVVRRVQQPYISSSSHTSRPSGIRLSFSSHTSLVQQP